mmetsp:Transcript_12541/g.21116  ORF Transcript_12541/g.21116 Transcript_12541/m.21116 type:complete len:126 (-) Transcript_12541:92-469(-)
MHEAFNGEQAVEQVRAQSCDKLYHLIFMDCNMPFKDGYQATREIREAYRQLNRAQPYIVAVTGHGEQEFVKMALDSGMDQVVVKPAQPAAIKEIVEWAKSFSQHDYDIPSSSIQDLKPEHWNKML